MNQKLLQLIIKYKTKLKEVNKEISNYNPTKPINITKAVMYKEIISELLNDLLESLTCNCKEITKELCNEK